MVPQECKEVPSVAAYLERLMREQGPIAIVRPVAVRQSMRNGGGPACLRMRAVLNERELRGVAPGVLVDHPRLDALAGCIRRRYRDRLSAGDLGDPELLQESRAALDEISALLGLSGIYDFQR